MTLKLNGNTAIATVLVIFVGAVIFMTLVGIGIFMVHGALPCLLDGDCTGMCGQRRAGAQ